MCGCADDQRLAFDKFPNEELAAHDGVSYVGVNALMEEFASGRRGEGTDSRDIDVSADTMASAIESQVAGNGRLSFSILPSKRSNPSRMVSGCGGQPGM